MLQSDLFLKLALILKYFQTYKREAKIAQRIHDSLHPDSPNVRVLHYHGSFVEEADNGTILNDVQIASIFPINVLSSF